MHTNSWFFYKLEWFRFVASDFDGFFSQGFAKSNFIDWSNFTTKNAWNDFTQSKRKIIAKNVSLFFSFLEPHNHICSSAYCSATKKAKKEHQDAVADVKKSDNRKKWEISLKKIWLRQRFWIKQARIHAIMLRKKPRTSMMKMLSCVQNCANSCG